MPQIQKPNFLNSVPAADAHELGGDTGWAEWNDAVNHHNAAFAPTAPASLSSAPRDGSDPRYAPTEPAPLRAEPPQPQPALSLSLAPMQSVSLEQVLDLSRHRNRVCPLPDKWTEFFALLRDASNGARLPGAPLTGGAWSSTPPLAKRMCFREQIEWAAAHGCLDAAHTFIRDLHERDWYYMG